MYRKYVLAVDPGETCGFAMLSYKTIEDVVVTRTWDHSALPLDDFARYFRTVMRKVHHLEPVVVEDYVIYASAAQLHIGRQLITPKLIGVIEAVCALQCGSPNRVILMPAAKKGRWPDAKVERRFPRILSTLESEHEKDAVKLGLAYIEGASRET